jgi:hypothetical protein
MEKTQRLRLLNRLLRGMFLQMHVRLPPRSWAREQHVDYVSTFPGLSPGVLFLASQRICHVRHVFGGGVSS